MRWHVPRKWRCTCCQKEEPGAISEYAFDNTDCLPAGWSWANSLVEGHAILACSEKCRIAINSEELELDARREDVKKFGDGD